MTESPYEALLQRIARETQVVADGVLSHSTLGIFRERESASGLRTREGHEPAVVWRFVYLNYYAADARGVELLRSSRAVVRPLVERQDAQLTQRLRSANCGSCYFDPGWVVAAAAGDVVVVRRGGLTLRCHRAGIRGRSLERGAEVSVKFPAELPYAYPGCYLAIGEEGLCRNEDLPLVRLYYTVAAEPGAVAVMGGLTRLLNDERQQFQIKVMNHPENLERLDSFVLYLSTTSWERLRPQLVALHREVAGFLRDGGPAFTKPLARGWSFAEEPRPESERTSFGQSRSILVAEGLTRAARAGERSPAGRYEAIVSRFEEAGVDVARPYLSAAGELIGGKA